MNFTDKKALKLSCRWFLNFSFGLVSFRRIDVQEEEEVNGWVPLAIKISTDSTGMRITKIDEVRLLFSYCYFIRFLHCTLYHKS